MMSIGRTEVIDTKWLHWHQTIGPLTHGVSTKILHNFNLNHLEGYKGLHFNLTLNPLETGDPFEKLLILFGSSRQNTSTKSNHYHFFSLDRCAVRIFLKGHAKEQITKWVHVESEKPVITNEMPESMILARFEDPYFIPAIELKQLKVGNQDGVSPTVDFGEIEIRGRLKLCCYKNFSRNAYQECKFNEGFEKWLRQDLSLSLLPKFSGNSFNNFVTIGSEGADIKIAVKNDAGSTFSVHSFVLSAQSPVFRKMLSIDMVEKSKGVITIVDASYNTLELFVQLLYGSKTSDELLTLPAAEVSEILSLAHRYQVGYLVRDCCMAIMTYGDEDLNLESIKQICQAGTIYVFPDFEYRTFQWLKCQRRTAKEYDQVTTLLRELDEGFVRKCCDFLLRKENPEIQEDFAVCL
ncbi:unnamed protein product [Allacma fusca]|uniref:BTB domain-containing protein n=1 Tax=Allacma fusca TaxID=39272 RepID=A0A8J2JHT8_9HEXA|nr:unnamed protein product [Allacma fusca]